MYSNAHREDTVLNQLLASLRTEEGGHLELNVGSRSVAVAATTKSTSLATKQAKPGPSRGPPLAATPLPAQAPHRHSPFHIRPRRDYHAFGSPVDPPRPTISRIPSPDFDYKDVDYWLKFWASEETKSERIYNVSVDNVSSLVTTWYRAGDATQGHSGAKAVRIITDLPQHAQPDNLHKVAYVVFEGLKPGIYPTWALANAQVSGVPRNIHKGFHTLLQAERAYIFAYAMGAVRALPPRSAAVNYQVPAVPLPTNLLAKFAELPAEYFSAEWYVVFQGKLPGVYPTWNIAATQVTGVSCALHQKYADKEEAYTAFYNARLEGRVKVL